MSKADSPSATIKQVAGEQCEIQRLEGGDIAVAIEDNGQQSLVIVATDGARAFVSAETTVNVADAIEAAHSIGRGLRRLESPTFNR